MDTNYFVCTLGHASVLHVRRNPYRTITQFLEYQSNTCGSKPAVGFPLPHLHDEWGFELLTFRELLKGTQIFAQRLSNHLTGDGHPRTVALMAHSSPEFLFTWLGLIYLGHSVLLLAPQCQPGAIVHLCRTCEASIFLYDAAHAQRAADAKEAQGDGEGTRFFICALPLGEDENLFRVIRQQPSDFVSPSNVQEQDVAYLHHTSGTSSGLPKPIPQTHRGAMGVLPHLPGPIVKATFTTTPLYHGGIADAFRSWTSDSPIWLFPGEDVPITARNVSKCLEVADACASNKKQPPVKYFSSVPYVLQLMEADENGLKRLKTMDIVGVGGASLPIEVGDRLVRNNVNLVSRFGSAECGFLLSSYRDFEKDKDWQYLRNYNPKELLNFESRENGLSELVVKPGWPHMAKKNRGDGSFTTADLFENHSKISNAWFYHSRADSQLTLITGKKFDPAPLEAAVATSEHLDDVLIFGDQRPYPGLLLLRSEKSSDMSDAELLTAIWPQIEKLNNDSQDHARIPQHMLIPIEHQDEPLEKSSKGTVMRKAAEARFASHIDAAYGNQQEQESKDVADEEVPQYLTDLVQSMIQSPKPPAEDTDLFSYGVDSIACMRLRSHLRQLTPNYTKDFPLSVIEDCGTIRDLSKYILRKRHGEADVEIGDEKQIMLDLAAKYSDFSHHEPAPAQSSNGQHNESSAKQVVLLTGATGALGAHILSSLRVSPSISTIYCLVRGPSPTAAQSRVNKALSLHDFPSLSSPTNAKVEILQAELSEPHLGLTPSVYTHLASTVTSILHVAWTVNFRLKLRSFEDNIAGVRHLLDLALAEPRDVSPRFTYCSSTAAIINARPDDTGRIPETLSSDPVTASPLGYSRSKWVAEHICAAAQRDTRLRDRIAIVRVGQLAGDSRTGIWNAKEAWPLLLSTVQLIKCLPDLGDEALDWLPVDVAARAFVEASSASGTSISGGEGRSPEANVFHVLNPHRTPTWRTALSWLRAKQDFEVVPPKEWVERLAGYEGGHSSSKLLGLWTEAYGGNGESKDQGDGGSGDRDEPARQFSISHTAESVQAMRGIGPLDEAYVRKVWDWVMRNVE